MPTLHRFNAPVAIEGQKAKASRALRVTIPHKVRDEMYTEGAAFPNWVRATIDGSSPTFLYGRRPKSRASVDFTLPQWCFPNLQQGQTVLVTVESATPYKAPPPVGDQFDWCRFLQDSDDYFPAEMLSGAVQLWNRYSPPFTIHRHPKHDLHWWFLGFYQAEGSKGSTAENVTISQKIPAPLGESIKAIETAWGIPRERMHLEVLYPKGKKPEPYTALYKPLGIEITAVRERVDKRGDIGEEAGVLHINRSKPLVTLVKRALVDLHEGKWTFPSRTAARAYALGWLDGDGTITTSQPLKGRRGALLELRLSGYEHEQNIVLQALHYGFTWETKGGQFSNTDGNRARSLRIHEAVDLAIAGAFRFDLSRARLLYAIERRLKGPPRHVTAAELDAAQLRVYKHLDDEFQELHRVMPHASMPVGQKSVPYPLTAWLQQRKK